MNHFSPALSAHIQEMLWERQASDEARRHRFLLEAVEEDLEYRKVKPDLPVRTRPFHKPSQRQKRKAARRRGF